MADSNIIEVGNYVGGKHIYSKENFNTLYDINQNPTLKISLASPWTIEAAIETASRVQPKLQKISLDDIVKVIDKSMEYYFDDDEKYDVIIRLTGSPKSFVKGGIEFIKDWSRNLNPYVKSVFGETNNIYLNNSSPVVAVLPSNSEYESLYVMAQTLLSRNSAIIRPSSKGASSYAALEFISALNNALDDLKRDDLDVLRESISILSTNKDYLRPLSVNDWNYVVFGDDNSVNLIESQIKEFSNPRKVIGFGTGFSSSIVFNDVNLEQTIENILQSVTVNRGNECDSTSVVYVSSDIYSEFMNKLEFFSKAFRSSDPFESGSIGLTEPENISYIYNELYEKRGKNVCLEGKLLHTTIVPLHEYETAMEYPGPIVSVREFNSKEQLDFFIQKDLRDNNKRKNLVTSIYTDSKEKFEQTLSLVRAYTVKHNIASHKFNPLLPHQGVYLLKELVDRVYLDR